MVARAALLYSPDQNALGIENKRRKATGEELLTALEEEPDEEDETDTSAGEDGEDEEDDATDVLLSEAGNVLVDALVLKQQRYAVHNGQKTVE